MHIFGYKWQLSIGFCLWLFAHVAHAELVLWHNRSANEHQFLEQMLDEFYDENAIKITLVRIQSQDYKAELINSAADGVLPDAILVPADFLGLYQYLNLSKIPSYQQPESISADLYQTTRIKGAVYGIPLTQGNQLQLYYNKRLVATPATQWSQLQQQKAQFDSQNLHTIVWSYHEMYWFIPFVGAFGGNVFKNGQVQLNTEAMLNALTYYKQLATSQLVDQRCDYACALNLFLTRKSAYLIDGDWRLQDLIDGLGADLGVAPLPMISPEQPLIPMYSSLALAFPNDGLSNIRVKNELVRLLEFLSSYDVQRAWYTEQAQYPAHQQVIADMQQDTNTAPSQQLLFKPEHKGQMLPIEEEMSYIWQAMSRGFNLFFYHGFSAVQSASYMQKSALRDIKNNLTSIKNR